MYIYICIEREKRDERESMTVLVYLPEGTTGKERE
jgi:hypothetical protein